MEDREHGLGRGLSGRGRCVAENVGAQRVARMPPLGCSLNVSAVLARDPPPLADGLLRKRPTIGTAAHSGDRGEGAESGIVLEVIDAGHEQKSITVDRRSSTMDDRKRTTIVDMTTMGARLKDERKAQQLTQEQLADEAGVSKQAVSAIENGTTKDPSAATLEPICRRLNLSMRYVLTGRPPKYVSDPSSQHLGWDFQKIRQATTLLAYHDEIVGVSPALLEDGERLKIAYQVIETASGESASADLVDLTRKLADQLRARENDNAADRREAAGTGTEDGGSDAARTGRKAKTTARRTA